MKSASYSTYVITFTGQISLLAIRNGVSFDPTRTFCRAFFPLFHNICMKLFPSLWKYLTDNILSHVCSNGHRQKEFFRTWLGCPQLFYRGPGIQVPDPVNLHSCTFFACYVTAIGSVYASVDLHFRQICRLGIG